MIYVLNKDTLEVKGYMLNPAPKGSIEASLGYTVRLPPQEQRRNKQKKGSVEGREERGKESRKRGRVWENRESHSQRGTSLN